MRGDTPLCTKPSKQAERERERGDCGEQIPSQLTYTMKKQCEAGTDPPPGHIFPPPDPPNKKKHGLSVPQGPPSTPKPTKTQEQSIPGPKGACSNLSCRITPSNPIDPIGVGRFLGAPPNVPDSPTSSSPITPKKGEATQLHHLSPQGA